ncbi:hypothetical protein AJ79_08044 [Helicocarpus griseus UAMH5409]|uniref:non-specific serine/threonine protein kinase n=1 Tax=Helicocarpus griseus UAMH5409 TaxID=1447875 RepID=A0A2B7WNW8_9EURO|nr:hypothetical protein AJ79_08044 [Helicocarpus griseus UAMH5409]
MGTITNTLRRPLAISPRLVSSVSWSSLLFPPYWRPPTSLAPGMHGIDSTSGSAEMADDPYFKYRPTEDLEKLERYQPGGYHPVSIDDCFGNRCRVVHKLGFDTYSTIWLAKDQVTANYVAIKFTVADSDSHESGILRQLSSVDLGARHSAISPILD